jgi:primosomal protein N' (replication factor Y)
MSTLFTPPLASAGYAQVAIERGMDQHPDGLTYAVPEPLRNVRPGDRVRVPLGRGDTTVAGYVIERLAAPSVDPARIKPIEALDAAGASLPMHLIELARWISSYYVAPIGITISAMMPAAVKKNIGAVTHAFLDLGARPPPDEAIPAKQRAVLAALAALPPERRPIEQRSLMTLAGVRTAGPIRALVERRLLRATHRTRIEASWAEQSGDAAAPRQLTAGQARIVAEVGATLGTGFSTHLIYGVTGSGKTEIYIRLIERVLRAGRAAIVLVPEIALTPQTGGRLIGRFPNERVAVLHSGLTAAQRHQQWSMIARGEASIVLGARSAVFAPIPDGRLGLIVVDEEHDGSYKQDQMPRYHGRDAAIRRGQLAGCTVVLGSATPALESWHNAASRGSYVLHRLTDRIPGAKLPRVTVVDFADQMRQHHDHRVHLIGPLLEAAIAQTLDRGRQVLILLNRRGYASYIACPDRLCGWVMTCDECDVTVVYHLNRSLPAGGYVQCHHCSAERKLPATCPQSGHRLVTFGLGTQRVEEELSRRFPQLIEGSTMLRLDSDAMRCAQDYHKALDRFGRGEVRLLVGTQMIAKGLDFPGVDLVGVINADTAVNLPDFRATERTFQLVNQVAGRSGRAPVSGRGGEPGRVIVQTFHPSMPAIRFAAAHDYEGFARHELADRERCGLPPFSRLARIVVRDPDHIACIAAARRLAAELHSLSELSQPGVRLRGPAPCPIARIAGFHRQQVEVLAPSATALHVILTAARNAGFLRPGAAMAIDVDPVALL